MARTLVTIETCDLCRRLKLPEAEAEGSENMAFGGAPRRFELCAPHRHVLMPYIEMYQDEDFGVDESLKPGKRGARKKEGTEPEDSGSFPIPVQVPRQLEMAPTAESAQKPTKEKPGKEKSEDRITVTCPLPHATAKGGTIKYKSRANHADRMHGLKAWDIEWGDPEGVLTEPCKAHAQCMKVKLAFPSQMSVARHVRMCPLEKLADDELEHIA